MINITFKPEEILKQLAYIENRENEKSKVDYRD